MHFPATSKTYAAQRSKLLQYAEHKCTLFIVIDRMTNSGRAFPGTGAAYWSVLTFLQGVEEEVLVLCDEELVVSVLVAVPVEEEVDVDALVLVLVLILVLDVDVVVVAEDDDVAELELVVDWQSPHFTGQTLETLLSPDNDCTASVHKRPAAAPVVQTAGSPMPVHAGAQSVRRL